MISGDAPELTSSMSYSVLSATAPFSCTYSPPVLCHFHAISAIRRWGKIEEITFYSYIYKRMPAGDETGFAQGTGLLDLDAGLFHHLRVSRPLGLERSREFGGRARHEFERERVEARARFRQLHDAIDLGVQLVDDRGRRTGGREEREPRVIGKSREAGFGNRRDIRQDGRTLRTGDRNGANAPGLDQRHRRRHRGGGNRHLVARRRVDRLRRSHRHVRDIHL